MSDPRMPTGLGAAGKAFWRKIVAEYDPSTADVERLTLACRLKDRIAAASAIIAHDGLMPDGKRHELLPQLRADERLFDQVLARLGLVDEAGHAPADGFTARAQAANAQRWGGEKARQVRDELSARRKHRAADAS